MRDNRTARRLAIQDFEDEADEVEQELREWAEYEQRQQLLDEEYMDENLLWPEAYGEDYD